MTRRTRRQFLEESMLATAAATVSAARPLFGMAETSRSANEKLGVAIVGVRGRGGSHIGALAGRKDAEVLYLCDVDSQVLAKRRQEVEKRQGRAPRCESDLRRVLEDPRVDVVSIATPNHLHALQAIWAMQAGKDVYVERPVSHNVCEGRRMVEAARRYGRICQSGLQSRSNPGMAAAMDFLAEGGIGRPRSASAFCYAQRSEIGPRGDYPIPPHIHYDLWLGPAPWEPLARPRFHHDWNWQWAYGGGDLGNHAAQLMDLARWALGVNSISRSVLSYGCRFGDGDAGETANLQVVLHDFGPQSLVFELRGPSADPTRGVRVGLTVECEDGYLVTCRGDGAAVFDRDGVKIRDFRGSGDHFANFLKAVRSGRCADLNADIEQGHLSSALCHLGNVSFRAGRVVEPARARDELSCVSSVPGAEQACGRFFELLKENRIGDSAVPVRVGTQLQMDPVTETCDGNSDASAWLTRTYRAPYVVPLAGQV